MLDFELLRDARRAVREFSVRHYPSVAAFHPSGRPWFNVAEGDDDDGAGRIPHRTTGATCLESLSDLRASDTSALIDEVAPLFAQRLLVEQFDYWTSDGAAFVYSRVRSLPAIIGFAPTQAQAHIPVLNEHLQFIWANVGDAPPDQGVREATRKSDVESEPLTIANWTKHLERAYPANAFHTYWALKTLLACGALDGGDEIADAFESKRQIALLWTQNMLAAQVALHAAQSDQADPNQLAWALASQLVDPFTEVELATGELSREPLYKAALAAFFDQQLPSGKWPLGQPLFHYPRAGNAYCYTFETLAELIRPALYETPMGMLLRELLKPHVPGLIRAWEFARVTARPLKSGPPGVGWSSGHHPHRTHPEGWATASVFSFLQRFRRLLGAYTREVVATELGVRPSRYAAAHEGVTLLGERGRTWTGGKHYWSAGEQLAALFLHPLQAGAERQVEVDPDRPLIEREQARSAILFGPAGTSKTTLVEALAGAIEWDFVEIHASRFLAEGIDRVPRSADAIFVRLMGLDRCVVLFDEIDELLRNRQGADADPFGRFLTTSMLPKVATLWDQGRLIFFVATNDISGADPAIKRSQRFDSAIFVAPPSFDVKLEQLRQHLPEVDLTWLQEDAVESALREEKPLGYLALLRFDQINELVDLLRGGRADQANVERALNDIGERLKTSDWQDNVKTPFALFADMRASETRDHRMAQVVLVDGEPTPNQDYEVLSQVPARDGQPARTYLRLVRSTERPPAQIESRGTQRAPNAVLHYT